MGMYDTNPVNILEIGWAIHTMAIHINDTNTGHP